MPHVTHERELVAVKVPKVIRAAKSASHMGGIDEGEGEREREEERQTDTGAGAGAGDARGDNDNNVITITNAVTKEKEKEKEKEIDTWEIAKIYRNVNRQDGFRYGIPLWCPFRPHSENWFLER